MGNSRSDYLPLVPVDKAAPLFTLRTEVNSSEGRADKLIMENKIKGADLDLVLLVEVDE